MAMPLKWFLDSINCFTGRDYNTCWAKQASLDGPPVLIQDVPGEHDCPVVPEFLTPIPESRVQHGRHGYCWG